MTIIAGHNRTNRPFFFFEQDGDRVEFPSFGEGQGNLEGNELREFNMYVAARQIDLIEFNPLFLFLNGENGAWWDIQDLTTLFSDAGGATPAAIGDPLRYISDKSGNGHHLINTGSTAPILTQRTDGVYYADFAGGKTTSVPASQALFKYLHDGTGCSIVAMLEWPQGENASTFLSTGAATTQVGVSITKSATSESAIFGVQRGVSGQQTGSAQISRAFLSSPLKMIWCSYKNDGGADDFAVAQDASRTKYTAGTTNAPSTASAALALTIANTFGGHFYGSIMLDRLVTDDEASNLYQGVFRPIDYPVAAVDLTLLLGGQSNMSGRGTVTTAAAEEKLVGVYSYTKAEEFRLATVPEHGLENQPVVTDPTETLLTPQHGFALRMGKALKVASDKDVLLVPCAIGSTSIAEWDTPETKDDRTTLYGAMVHRYRQAMAKGGQPVIVWYGHEGSSSLPVVDYTTGGVGTAYQEAWASLIDHIREDVADAPLIFVQLASDNDDAPARNNAAVGEAQRQTELTIPNAYMVVAHDVQRNASSDDIHVSREGMDVIADRVALAVREHVLGEDVNGTGPRIVSAGYNDDTITLTLDKAVNESEGNYGDLFRVYDGGVEATVSSANRGTDTSTIEIVCSAPLTGPITLTYGYRAGPANAARTDIVKDNDGLPLPVFGPMLVQLA